MHIIIWRVFTELPIFNLEQTDNRHPLLLHQDLMHDVLWFDLFDKGICCLNWPQGPCCSSLTLLWHLYHQNMNGIV